MKPVYQKGQDSSKARDIHCKSQWEKKPPQKKPTKLKNTTKTNKTQTEQDY